MRVTGELAVDEFASVELSPRDRGARVSRTGKTDKPCRQGDVEGAACEEDLLEATFCEHGSLCCEASGSADADEADFECLAVYILKAKSGRKRGPG